MADTKGFGEHLVRRLKDQGLSRTQIYKALAMQRLADEVAALGAEGKLQEAALVEISKIESAARQKELAEVVVGCELPPPWVKELAKLIRNAEKAASDKEANRYWDFFFEVRAALELEGAGDELLDRVRNFSVEKVMAAEAVERSVTDLRRVELQPGRGLDVGTSNIVSSACTRNNRRLFNIQRNAFLDVRSDVFTKKMLMKLGIDHFIENDKGYVIGDAAFELANIFEKNTRRPMRDGMISPVEQEALFIEGLLLRQLLGLPKEPGEICSFSVPADPIDADRNVIYHRGVLESILRRLGYEPRAMVEGHAVVLGELEKDEYTGVGISCGAGMFNVCIAYKSVPALSFSTSRGGDWIDNNVAAALNMPSSQVCAVKESGVDLARPRDRVEEAIVIYYRNLIRYSLETIREKLDAAHNMPSFPDPVTIVCAGGTSMIKGFIEVFRQEFRSVDFPIPVKEIRMASDPLRTVSLGCLIDAMTETEARGSGEIPASIATVADETEPPKAERKTRKKEEKPEAAPKAPEAPAPSPAEALKELPIGLDEQFPPAPPIEPLDEEAIPVGRNAQSAPPLPKKLEPAAPPAPPEERHFVKAPMIRLGLKLPSPNDLPGNGKKLAGDKPHGQYETRMMDIADFQIEGGSGKAEPPPPKKKNPKASDDWPLVQ